jgi:hypothetical protein
MANTVPSCYRQFVRPVGERALRVGRGLGAIALALVAVGACGRTGLDDLGGVERAAPGPADAALGPTSQVGDAAAAPAPPSPSSTSPSISPPAPPAPAKARCSPTPESCNGRDDDCDGQIDQGLPAIPCAGGGEQYCVAGRYSACPERCQTCIPGSERVCFLSYCTFWATQTCAADGRSFGTCRERHVPPECADVSSTHKESPELEQCCIDHGYCCHDDYDLDGDGNRSEMLGRCDEVSCHP